MTPLSIFAQNNGVIAITRCANRTAGRFCCAFLILFGVLGKISGVFLASAYTAQHPRLLLRTHYCSVTQYRTPSSVE